MVPRLLVPLALSFLLAACGRDEAAASNREGRGGGEAPVVVTTAVLAPSTFADSLVAIGTARARESITVTAKVSETVQQVHFDSGDEVGKGAVLVTLSGQQQQAALNRALAAANEAQQLLTRQEGLAKQQLIARSQLDTQRAMRDQAQAEVAEVRAQLGERVIRAPFAGMLGIRQVNVGQYLSSGDPIVELQSLNPIYVNFDVPQQAIAEMRVGRDVRITSSGEASGAEFHGRITAVDSIVNAETRNIQVQATLANPAGQLRPGMFVQTEVVLGNGQPLIALPATAVSYAPFGDSVFVVTDLKGKNGESYRGVRQQFVKLEGSRGDQIGIASGVKAGEEVVTSGVFKLRNGAAVLVNNKVQPANNPAPQPEDN